VLDQRGQLLAECSMSSYEPALSGLSACGRTLATFTVRKKEIPDEDASSFASCCRIRAVSA